MPIKGYIVLSTAVVMAAITLLAQTVAIARSKASSMPLSAPVLPELSETVDMLATESLLPQEIEEAKPLTPSLVADLLVDAIIQVESAGDPRKIGSSGERGVMQIKRSTWREVTDRAYGKALPFYYAFHPGLNRRVGKAYLNELQAFLSRNKSRWQSDERSLLLACYNAGPERVKSARFNIRNLPRSVRSYVDRATALHEYYLADDAQEVRRLLMAKENGAPAIPGRS